jgi:hypothetical protein
MVGICTFCFASKGETPADARQKANRTGNAVLFFEGIFRYALFPNDDNLYEYTTKDDVFDLERKKIRNDIIKQFGIDPDTSLPA